MIVVYFSTTSEVKLCVMAHKIFLVCGAIQILPCALYVELNYTSPLLVNSPLICRQDIYSVQLTLKVMFSTDHYRVPPQPHALSYISGRPTLTQEKLFTALDLAALLRLFCGIAPCRCYVPCWLVLSGDCTLLLTARKYPQGGCTSGSPFAECVARQPSC